MLRLALRNAARPAPRVASAPLARLYSTDNKIQETPNELIVNEDKLGLETAKTTGAPDELTQRSVNIYKMSPSATQSGRQQQKGWRINWDVVDRANRWEDPLIGYASSGDYMQATEMHFHTKEDAIRFATSQGWNYYVREPKKRDFHPKAYGDNFLHVPGKLKMIFTK